jgi:VanZ family protein
LLNYLEKNKKLLVYTPLIVYWLILFTATTLPAESVPSIGVTDKLNHLTAYLILSVLIFLTLFFQRKYLLTLNSVAIYTIIICFVYGIIDEVHQILIPGRNAELLDWLSDAAGSVIGVFIMILVVKRYNYKTETAD